MILDTCALVWLASDQSRLSPTAIEQIRSVDTLFVSAISAFELALKQVRGGIALPCAAGEWYQRVLAAHDLIEIPLSGEAAIAAANLPWHHRDPADRFIIATAQLRRLPVLTPDAQFSRYDVAVVW